MKVVFADSFFDSLKRIGRHNTLWYKLYSLFRYKIPWFFRNIIRFRRQLWRFRTWDSGYNLDLFRRSLELTCNNIEKNGNEIEESRNKKVVQMRRAIELMGNFYHSRHIDLAEEQLGVKMDATGTFLSPPNENIYRNIFDLADKLEREQWRELWDIIHGIGEARQNENGTDMRGWWD